MDKKDRELALAQAEIERLRKTLTTALHALSSYQYGNGSPDLAKEVADKIENVLKEAGE